MMAFAQVDHAAGRDRRGKQRVGTEAHARRALAELALEDDPEARVVEHALREQANLAVEVVGRDEAVLGRTDVLVEIAHDETRTGALEATAPFARARANPV